MQVMIVVGSGIADPATVICVIANGINADSLLQIVIEEFVSDPEV